MTYETDAADPVQVGDYTARVVYDPEPTPPWEWDWGATVLDEYGHNFSGGDGLGSWRDYYSDMETAIRDRFHPVAIRRASTRSGPRFVFVTRDDLALTGCPLALAGELVDGCVRDFEQWAEGDVYGFVVEDATGDTVDSCWGFYGDTEYPMSEAVEIATFHDIADREALQVSYLTVYADACGQVQS